MAEALTFPLHDISSGEFSLAGRRRNSFATTRSLRTGRHVEDDRAQFVVCAVDDGVSAGGMFRSAMARVVKSGT